MAPRTQKQFEEMRESRRKQIMDSALELYATEGFSKCSIALLAQHAGISKGLMYNYFNSKEELLAAVIEHGMNEIMLLLDPNSDGILHPANGGTGGFYPEGIQQYAKQPEILDPLCERDSSTRGEGIVDGHSRSQLYGAVLSTAHRIF
jgi:AcrR family transcriptional regulator